MVGLAKRFKNNPIIIPGDMVPSIKGFGVGGVFNPGAFKYQGKIGLLLRVAEFPQPLESWVQAPIIETDHTIDILKFANTDPHLEATDPRVFSYKGKMYLTSISHLRLAWSEDGIHFKVDDKPFVTGEGKYEIYGIEDCRVTEIDGTFYLTYSAVSNNGVGVGLIRTRDWKTFERLGLIFPPTNRNCAIFPDKTGDYCNYYYAMHRPSGDVFGGEHIWISRSKDLRYWGDHCCVVQTRPGKWDCARIGAGAPPFRTPDGWLAIYHGADENNRYCLGALLLDLDDPTRVIARTDEPLMEPVTEYERRGFFGNVVFCNGQIVEGETLIIYYGAADETICRADFSISEIMNLF
ncbi:MAG: glycoside hydrolase family 130 protein [Candidatus Omnitrophota bacterium]